MMSKKFINQKSTTQKILVVKEKWISSYQFTQPFTDILRLIWSLIKTWQKDSTKWKLDIDLDLNKNVNIRSDFDLWKHLTNSMLLNLVGIDILTLKNDWIILAKRSLEYIIGGIDGTEIILKIFQRDLKNFKVFRFLSKTKEIFIAKYFLKMLTPVTQTFYWQHSTQTSFKLLLLHAWRTSEKILGIVSL